MKKSEKSDSQQLLARLEIRIRHLENELNLTREEREAARRQYYQIVTHFEKKVEERTRQMLKWQEVLRVKHQELQHILDFSPAMIFYLDRQHRFTRVNREFARAIGMKRTEIIGRRSVELFPTAGAALDRDEKAVYRSARPILDKPVQLECNGRSLHLLLSRVPQLDIHGEVTGIIGFGVNVTNWHETEQEKRRLEKQLLLSEKMGAIGLMAGGVAHDLNNMLSAIVCYPDLIMSQLPADSQVQRAVQTMQKSGQKAAAIVHDLLTLVRRGLSVNEVVSINQLITLYFASPEFEKLKSFHPQIEFAIDLCASLTNVRGSPLHLGSTLTNLVSNAAEAIAAKGCVKITTRNAASTSRSCCPTQSIRPVYTPC